LFRRAECHARGAWQSSQINRNFLPSLDRKVLPVVERAKPKKREISVRHPLALRLLGGPGRPRWRSKCRFPSQPVPKRSPEQAQMQLRMRLRLLRPLVTISLPIPTPRRVLLESWFPNSPRATRRAPRASRFRKHPSLGSLLANWGSSPFTQGRSAGEMIAPVVGSVDARNQEGPGPSTCPPVLGSSRCGRFVD
jgi:hypothetical protein